MKQIVIILSLLFLLVLNVNVFALGNLGTPTAELETGQLSVGGDYTYTEMELDVGNMTYFHSIDGWTTTAFEFDKVKTNLYYATFKYGLTDNWELFGRLGASDIEFKSRWPQDSPTWIKRDFDSDFFWGVGTKYTFYKQDKVSWGAAVQMSMVDTTSVYFRSSDSTKQTLDLSFYDLLIAVGPTVDMGGWKLYGGPFFYMLDGDADMFETWPAGWWKGSSDVEEDSNFGGYVGAAIPLAQDAELTFEVGSISSGISAGLGLNVKF